MSYTVSLIIQAETFLRFQQIHQQLNAQQQSSLAKPLGEVLANISCEVVEQVFGQASREHQQNDPESEKVLSQIKEAVQKYMPWSVSFFSNERLLPMVNYLNDMTEVKDGRYLLHYDVDNVIVKEILGCLEQIRSGNYAYIRPAFKAFTQVVDQGVTSLVRVPKTMLKFNFVVDKTLTGVINFTTQLGYKRLEKLASQFDAETTEKYLMHFFEFMHKNNTEHELV
jgi:hypothetical protein